MSTLHSTTPSFTTTSLSGLRGILTPPPQTRVHGLIHILLTLLPRDARATTQNPKTEPQKPSPPTHHPRVTATVECQFASPTRYCTWDDRQRGAAISQTQLTETYSLPPLSLSHPFTVHRPYPSILPHANLKSISKCCKLLQNLPRILPKKRFNNHPNSGKRDEILQCMWSTYLRELR